MILNHVRTKEKKKGDDKKTKKKKEKFFQTPRKSGFVRGETFESPPVTFRSVWFVDRWFTINSLVTVGEILSRGHGPRRRHRNSRKKKTRAGRGHVVTFRDKEGRGGLRWRGPMERKEGNEPGKALRRREHFHLSLLWDHHLAHFAGDDITSLIRLPDSEIEAFA